MDSIVHAAIHQVTKKKTGKEGQSIPSHQEIKERKEHAGYHYTGHGRHKKPLLIARKFMVYTMHSVQELLAAGTFRNHVKKMAVHKIFK